VQFLYLHAIVSPGKPRLLLLLKKKEEKDKDKDIMMMMHMEEARRSQAFNYSTQMDWGVCYQG
jgi:hypothetical protein